MFKLCYKEYGAKASIGAMKGFKKDTGEDLMFTLSRIQEAWAESVDLGVRARINALYTVCDFELAAYIFYYLIKGSEKEIPLAEVEDAMFRVGILPNDIDDEWCSPWPIVLVGLVNNIENDLLEAIPRKKPDTSE